jgi:Glycosyl transferase family 2
MPSGFSVVAIIAAHNEADVIEHVVRDLVTQNIQVYFLDDGSTDATSHLVEHFVGSGVIAVERLSPPPADQSAKSFDWAGILARKAQLSAELDADWFIHHDADEFRESPWSGISLKEGIRQVDRLGYNAIDFACLNFWPVNGAFEGGSDVRRAQQYYEPAPVHDRLQIRCWKKPRGPVDLVSSGGHEVLFPDRRVFPIRFILRHYPIRSQAHGERKVFVERRPRFREDERAKGWHIQYDPVVDGQNFVRDASTLVPYDGDAVRLSLSLHHRGVEELEDLLNSLHAEVSGCREAERRLDTALDISRRELAETTAILANTRAALDEKRQRADELQRLVAALASDVEALKAAQAREMEGLNAALERQAGDIAALRRELAESYRRIDDLHRSWSWRATASARAVYRVLRGR